MPSNAEKNSWDPIHVIIGDNNEIKLHGTQNPPFTESKNEENEFINHHNHEQNFINDNNVDEPIFGKRVRHAYPTSNDDDEKFEQLLNEFKQKTGNNLNNVNSNSKYIQSYHSPTRYLTPKLVNPSFSKIPDEYLKTDNAENYVDHFGSNHNEQSSDDHRLTSEKTDNLDGFNIGNLIDQQHSRQPMTEELKSKPLVVPVGSRVHVIKYKDYSKPDSSQMVTKFDYNHNAPIEPSVIELPSSQPVLPIVFNFKTKLSPIYTTMSHIPKKPKYHYFSTILPPTFISNYPHNNYIHADGNNNNNNYRLEEKQNPETASAPTPPSPTRPLMNEFFLPYEFYLQDYPNTIEGHSFHDAHHYQYHLDSIPKDYSSTIHVQNLNPYVPANEFTMYTPSAATTTNSFKPISGYMTATQHLVPYYGPGLEKAPISVTPNFGYMDGTSVNNPFVEYYHPPYRVTNVWENYYPQHHYHHQQPEPKKNYNKYNHFNN